MPDPDIGVSPKQRDYLLAKGQEKSGVPKHLRHRNGQAVYKPFKAGPVMQYLLLQCGYSTHILRMYMMPDTPLQGGQRIVPEIISIKAVYTAEKQFYFDLLKLLSGGGLRRLIFIPAFHRCHCYQGSLAPAVFPDRWLLFNTVILLPQKQAYEYNHTRISERSCSVLIGFFI
ncbi:hypothetical protein D3C75_905000 [compost metagenome]